MGVICVNGNEEVAWFKAMTVADVLEIMHFTYSHIYVRVNGELVPEQDYGRFKISDGSDVKVIHLMAGG
jgi:sulfur carrier protein